MDILFHLNQNKQECLIMYKPQCWTQQKKNKARRKGRQRSFGNYNNWLIVSNNEIADIEKLAFIWIKKDYYSCWK